MANTNCMIFEYFPFPVLSLATSSFTTYLRGTGAVGGFIDFGNNKPGPGISIADKYLKHVDIQE
jgi:hypothetical protein